MEQNSAPAALPPGFSFISFDGAPPEPETKLICVTAAYGDTLSGIAALFGTTAADIAASTPLKTRISYSPASGCCCG